jgi:hypothetical protein
MKIPVFSTVPGPTLWPTQRTPPWVRGSNIRIPPPFGWFISLLLWLSISYFRGYVSFAPCLGKADHSLPFRVEVKNMWSYNSVVPYAYVRWCWIKHRDNFTASLRMFCNSLFVNHMASKISSVVSLSILPVAQAGWQDTVNNEFKGSGRKRSWCNRVTIPKFAWRDRVKPRETSVKIDFVPA